MISAMALPPDLESLFFILESHNAASAGIAFQSSVQTFAAFAVDFGTQSQHIL
jgi:hypothetical protein